MERLHLPTIMATGPIITAAPILTLAAPTTVDAIEWSALARHTAGACVAFGFANNDNRRDGGLF